MCFLYLLKFGQLVESADYAALILKIFNRFVAFSVSLNLRWILLAVRTCFSLRIPVLRPSEPWIDNV